MHSSGDDDGDGVPLGQFIVRRLVVEQALPLRAGEALVGAKHFGFVHRGTCEKTPLSMNERVDECRCFTSLTYVTEQHGQEDEAVRGAQQHDGQVHPKVEHLEDLGLGKRQDQNSSEFGQRDPAENLQQGHEVQHDGRSSFVLESRITTV